MKNDSKKPPFTIEELLEETFGKDWREHPERFEQKKSSKKN
jgi:hypothetical protein